MRLKMTISTTAIYKDSTRVNVGKMRLYERREPGAPFTVGQCRGTEILKFIRAYAGNSLPDDEFGRVVLFELLNQMKLDGASADDMRNIALDLMPEIDDDDSLDDMIKGNGKKRSADQIAKILGIDYQMRTFLDLRSIGACDVPKAERARLQRQKEAMDKAWQREQAGAKPQSKSAARTRPWIAMGIGKTKYYTLKKAEKAAAAATQNEVREPLRRRTLLSSHGQNSSDGRGAPFGRLAAALRSAGEGLVPDDHLICSKVRPSADRPAVDPASHCQASSSFDQPETEGVVPEVPAGHGADISGRDRTAVLREAYRARNALGPSDADGMRRLDELDGIIETARRKLASKKQVSGIAVVAMTWRRSMVRMAA
jgi:hypothetical protein